MHVEPDRRDPDASRLTRSDLNLRNRAIRERWAVPPELIVETLYQVQEILAEPRLKLAAGRLPATLVRVDKAEDKLDLERARTAKPEAADARSALLDEALDLIHGRRPQDPGHPGGMPG